MEREIYDEDHEAFRDVVKEFLKRYATEEKRKQWEADGEIDRATMLAAGEAGIIGLSVPEEFGGAGMLQDYRFRAIVLEETIGAGQGSLAGAFGIQDDLAVPYIVHMGTQEQKEKWLPGMATGEILGALAMTEPGAGSDLRGIKTTAKKVDGGYLVNGAKTFISSGKTADMVVTFVKTGEGNRPDAFSLLILEDGMEGFDHSKKLEKMGFHGWDTAELSFTDVFVPDANLIGGKEGMGFIQLMMNLPLERLSIGVAAAAAGEAAFHWTRDYVLSREAFGERIGRPLPPAAGIAVASPITGDVIRLTNNPWVIQPALLAARRGANVRATALAALGAAAKLFPVLLLPLLGLGALFAPGREWGTRIAGAARLVAVALLAWGAVNLPVALFAFDNWREFYAFSSERSGTAASVWELLAQFDLWVTDIPTRNLWSFALFAGGAGVIVATGWRRHGDRPWLLFMPVLAWFLLTNKVYSPQFDLWLWPAIVLTGTRPRAAALFLLGDLAAYVAEFWLFAGMEAAHPSATRADVAAAAIVRAVAMLWLIVGAVRDPAPAWVTRNAAT